jgi:phosphodiester glycosidase
MIARLSFIFLLLIGGSAGLPAQPQKVDWRTIAPGVEHAEIRRNGANGDLWAINALRVDLAQVRLDVVHALDAAVGLETVSSIAQRRDAVAAINGGYFRTTGTFRGDSTGTLQIDRTLLSEPDRARAAVGFVRTSAGATQLIFGHVTWDAAIDAGGKKRALDGINRPRGADEMVMFTPAFHQTTLTDASGTEIVVRRGRVVEVREQAGSTPIPADGFVLSAKGAARDWAREHLKRRAKVKVSAALKPADDAAASSAAQSAATKASAKNPWATAEDVVGGGPRIVTAGRVDITLDREKVQPSFSTTRHPRTAIASLPGNKALLVVVDGRQPALSVGMSLDELARLMIELGAVEAINLDGGGSSTMTIDGKVVNHPSDVTGERPVSDAILVLPATRRPG